MREINEYKRIISIGDIHGHYEKVKELWEKICFNDDEDLLIFHGDYIDRGPEPVRTLQFVKSLVKGHENIIALKGNHEVFMQSFFDRYPFEDGECWNAYDLWLDPRNGGDITIEQLRNLDRQELAELLHFVQALPLYLDMGKYFFVHAGVNPRKHSLSEQTEEDLLWIREMFILYYNGEKNIIVGHTPVQYLAQKRNEPLLLANNILLLDTGTAFGRELSAVNVLDLTYLQSGGQTDGWQKICC